jgi:hypothetical protein
MTHTILILVSLVAFGCGRAILPDDDQVDAACPPADSGPPEDGADDATETTDGADSPYCATLGVVCGGTGDVQACRFEASGGCVYTVTSTVQYGGGVICDSDGRLCDFGLAIGGTPRTCTASGDGTDGMVCRATSGGSCWTVRIDEVCP